MVKTPLFSGKLCPQASIDGVEQKLPLCGRPKLARRVANTESSTREAELRYRLLELRRDPAKQLLAAA
jgi:hypothetical protein